jgi:hypothetical protein
VRPRLRSLIPSLVVLSVATSAHAARSEREDERAIENAWEDAWEEAIVSPSRLSPYDALGGRGLAISLDVSAGKRLTSRGERAEWFAGLVLAVPLDRLFGAGAPRPLARWIDGFPRGLAARPEETMRSSTFARESWDVSLRGRFRVPGGWGAALVLPTALAAAPLARGEARPAAGTGTAAASRSSIAAIVSAPPSLASSLRLPASVSAAIRTAPSVAPSTMASSPRTEVRAVGERSGEADFSGDTLPSGALRGWIRAAWREAGVEDDARLDAMESRARGAAWAPEVRVRAYRGTNNGANVYATADAADRATLTDGVSTMIETRLIWRLDRVVFADDELAIERVRLERAELRQRIAARVIELALAWLRARRAADDPALLGPDRELARATAVEALLALDALTGGAASRSLGAAAKVE